MIMNKEVRGMNIFFDTREGNYLCKGVTEVYKEYKVQSFLKMEKGKLVKIIHTEQREKLKELMKGEEEDDQTASDGI